ncbi:MAG: sugar metabolism transcriptional regulator [Desulfobacteraceae bacterium]|nr:sugar metabolism transcriptional regulator [Desulfobacteraceae bacterium]MBC2719981.1 FeoC-like transcriptional regulator [Desulfobacteraceae bacterium]
MILSDIRKYLSENRIVSLKDLSVHFDIEPDAMQGMLQEWIRKGKVRKCSGEPHCSYACAQCSDPAAMELYEWT